MAKLFTHTPKAASYVLRRHATDSTSYTAVAKAGGRTYLSMPQKHWQDYLRDLLEKKGCGK